MLLGIMVLTLVFLGIYNSLGIMTSEEGYNVDTSEDVTYKEKYDNILDIGKDINDSYTSLQGVTPDKGAGFFTGVASAFSLGKTIVSAPFNVINLLWSAISQDLNLPIWVNGVFVVTLLILIIFALLTIILRYKV